MRTVGDVAIPRRWPTFNVEFDPYQSAAIFTSGHSRIIAGPDSGLTLDWLGAFVDPAQCNYIGAA